VWNGRLRKGIKQGRGTEGGGREGIYFSLRTGYPLSTIHLNDPSATAGFCRHTIEPQNTGDIHLLVRRNTSGEFDKLEHSACAVQPPSHLLVCALEMDSGYADKVTCALEPGHSTSSLGRVVRLEWKLQRIDL